MKSPRRSQRQPEHTGIYPVNGVTVIKWRPVEPPPEEDCYVLLRFDDLALGETAIETAAYHQGKFEVRAENGQWIQVPAEQIRGWTYPIFDPIPETAPPGPDGH